MRTNPPTCRVGTSAIVALFLMAALPAAAGPDVIPLTDPDPANYTDRFFGGSSPISGNLLVGLNWEPAGSKFDPSHIGVWLPAGIRGQTACVNVASEDGRYFAQNLYTVPRDHGPFGVFATRTKHSERLQNYATENVAVMVRVTASCENGELGPVLPVVLGPAPGASGDAQALVAFVNADPERLSVRIMRDKQVIATAPACTTDASHVRIAFTSRCVVRVPPQLAGHIELVIALQERFHKTETRFSLILDRQ